MSPVVEIEADAVPLVRVFAAMSRRSLAQPSVAKQVAKLTGVVGVQSATDPQAASIRFESGTVRIVRGIANDADVTMTVDLNDDSARPKLKGAVRHPALTMAVAKLLDPPIDDWQNEAERFFEAALRSQDCPRPVRVVCSDDGTLRQWGGDDEPAMQIHGSADQLARAASGSSIMAADIAEGRLDFIGDMRALSLLTGFAVDHLFGELT